MRRINSLLNIIMDYGLIAWGAAAVVWFVIVSTLSNGISCDEGFYLMGYLHGQNIEGHASDFHAIVRALCSPFADDDIMVYRYLRLILNVFAIIIFAISSFWWLSKKKGLSVSRWLYYPMIALAGAMSFTFAAPTISYDSLEVIITLFSFSMLFIQLTTSRNWLRWLSALGVGFFQWFAIANYPSAGICLTILLVIAYFIESGKEKWKDIIGFFVGIGVAIIIFHLYVHNLGAWFSNIYKIIISTFTETSMSRHDSGSLISGMLMTAGKQALLLIPIVIVSTLFYAKVPLKEWVLWAFTICICLFLLSFRKVYELRGTLMLIPVAIMLGKALANPQVKVGRYLCSKDFWLAFVFVAIPFAGIFGTNQAIMRKNIIFTAFWLVAYFLLTNKLDISKVRRLHLIVVVLLMAGYIYLGNFQRYQYYYTPRSSKYELEGATRMQDIKVSDYQRQYYADLIDSLQVAGCKPGDRYIAFEEDLMAVYLAGGYIEGALPYHWWQYTKMDGKAPTAFVLFKSEENNVIEHFKSADWDFPAAYRRMEMRQAAENMGDELRTVIYVRLTE